MGNPRLWIAMLLAAGAHVAFVWLWPMAERVERQVLDLTLDYAEPVPDTAEPPPSIEPKGESTPRQPELAAPAINTAKLEVPERARPTPPEPVLDLSRPETWPAAPRLEGVEEMVSAFRPQLYDGLVDRRREQVRARTLTERRVAVAGLSPDEYNAQKIDPTIVKTEQGCFQQRMDLDGRVIGEMRWWQVSCQEQRINPLLLPALEYDALGRAIGPSDL